MYCVYRLRFSVPVVSVHLDGVRAWCRSRCAVLAAANPSFGSFDDTQDSSEQHEFKATILSRYRQREIFTRLLLSSVYKDVQRICLPVHVDCLSVCLDRWPAAIHFSRVF